MILISEGGVNPINRRIRVAAVKICRNLLEVTFLCKLSKTVSIFMIFCSRSEKLLCLLTRVSGKKVSPFLFAAKIFRKILISYFYLEVQKGKMIIPVKWSDEGVLMLDQRLLPTEEKWLTLKTYAEVADGIRDMVVRGAPAIGVSAAYGMALGARQFVGMDMTDFEDEIEYIGDVLAKTRPTAVNLFWAIDRMKRTFQRAKAEGKSVSEIKQIMLEDAKAIHEEDIESQRLIAQFGGELIENDSTVLTHCNAGALATGGVWGTALGVIRGAVNQGKTVSVIADETRPYLQGARLTAWDLLQDDIPVTLITDNMSGHMMKKGKVQAVVVGSDRIAANGDVANKIGTYMVAVLARQHGIPFYVAAPLSTVDLNCPTGDDIPIEERDIREITHVKDIQLAPEGIGVSNYAFDVTPNEFVTAIITEKGVARAPYTESLRKQFEE
jgi:methylthioribose-1-phosphate isomerase